MALAVAAWGIDASCSAGRGDGSVGSGGGGHLFYFSFSKHFGFCIDLICLYLFVNLFIVNYFLLISMYSRHYQILRRRKNDSVVTFSEKKK